MDGQKVKVRKFSLQMISDRLFRHGCGSERVFAANESGRVESESEKD